MDVVLSHIRRHLHIGGTGSVYSGDHYREYPSTSWAFTEAPKLMTLITTDGEFCSAPREPLWIWERT